MSYKKALEILKALPPEKQYLAAGVYKFYENGKANCGCAVGKILPNFYSLLSEHEDLVSQGMEKLEDIIADSVNYAGDSDGLPETLNKDYVNLEITLDELHRLQSENDEYVAAGHHTNSEKARKERFNYIIAFMEQKIAKENAGNISPS